MLDVTFIPYGADAGDHERVFPHANFTVIGPFHSEIPVVFYLQQHHQLYVINRLPIRDMTIICDIIFPTWLTGHAITLCVMPIVCCV